MKTFFQAVRIICTFIILTIFTQVGGIIYLLYRPFDLKIKNKYESYKGYGLRMIAFTVFYLTMSFTLVPLAALLFNRIPMPITEEDNIKPGSFLICIANRHYVDPELKYLLKETAAQLPGDITLIYLDANFPLIDGFPLLPHLSHNDGNKIDIAFVYSDENGIKLNDTKS